MTDLEFFIETPRLNLSYFDPENDAHCDWLVELYNTPEFIASNGGRRTSVTSREVARSQLRTSFREEHARNGYGKYLVSLKPISGSSEPYGSGELVGMVSLMRGSGADALAVPDVGFVIHPTKTRQGFAKEAASGLLKYAERELGVQHALGLCEPDNVASQGVLRALGFENRGVRPFTAFGGESVSVWSSAGMMGDLAVYGL